MTRTLGVRAMKYDPFVDKLPVDIDQQQSIKLYYEVDKPNDVHQIKRVYGSCIEIEYPIERTAPIEAIGLIESQFAAHNAVDDLDDELIDRAIHDLIPVCLEHEGLELPDDKILASRVRALIIKQVRGISSTNNLIKYLEKNTDIAELLGFDVDKSVPGTSTFSRARHEFNINSRSASHSINRIRRTLYRNGILFDELSNTGCSMNPVIPQDFKLSDNLRYQVLLNWSELLLHQLTEGISFNRADNTKYTARQIIASLAIISLHKRFNKGKNLAQLRYQDDIITHNHIRQIINQNVCQDNFFESKHAIESLGFELNRNLLQFAADELSLLSGPLDIAFDSTWIPLKQDTDPDTKQGAMGNVKLKTGGGYQFATGVTYTPMSRFSLGVKLRTDKSELPEAFREMLLFFERFTKIGWILADREFDNPEVIELFRYMAGNNWIIRLRNNKNLIDSDVSDELEESGKKTISFGDTKINTFWKNNKKDKDRDEEKNKEKHDNSDEEEDEEKDEFIVLSGMPINETNASELGTIYNNRWAVETHIRELKHEFAIPLSTNHVLEYLFILNISSVFYNMCKIMRQSLSPLYGLPLRPKSYEMLLAIADATFQRYPQLQPDIDIP